MQVAKKLMTEKILKPLVITGPSGCGKSTVKDRLMGEHPKSFLFSTSCTTRPIRGAEVDGLDYYFLSMEDFDRKISNNEFIEWCEVYGNKYGTLFSEVDKAKKQEKILILDIDTKGGAKLRSLNFDALFLGITIPSIETLKERLIKRNTDKAEAIEKRLNTAESELEIIKKNVNDQFDKIVMNDDIDKFIKDFGDIVKEYQKL